MATARSHGMPNKRSEWNETRNRFRDSPTWKDGQFTYDNHVLDYCNKETCATYFDERRALRRRRANGTEQVDENFLNVLYYLRAHNLCPLSIFITSLHCHWPCAIHLHECASFFLLCPSLAFFRLLVSTTFNFLCMLMLRLCCFLVSFTIGMALWRAFIIWPVQHIFVRVWNEEVNDFKALFFASSAATTIRVETLPKEKLFARLGILLFISI